MVTIIRGIPGAGKSHYAHEKYPGALLLEADQYYMTPKGEYRFGEGMLKNSTEYVKLMLNAALSTGIKHVVITGTSPNGQTAKEYAAIAKMYQHEVQFIWLDCTSVCKKSYTTVHNVPEDVIESMKKNWVPFENEIMIERRWTPSIFDRDMFSYRQVYDYPKWYKKLHPTEK